VPGNVEQFAFDPQLDADLSEASMRFANLSNAELFGATLSGTDLRGAFLDGARLELANLNNSKLQAAHLQDSRLQATDFTGSQLALADFSRASVWRAYGADCKDSFVTETDYAAEISPQTETEEETVFKGPKGIRQFVDDLIENLEGDYAKRLDSILRGRMLVSDRNANNSKTGERAWRNCELATLERGAYERKLVPHRIELACEFLEADGYRNFLRQRLVGPNEAQSDRTSVARLLAQNLIDLDRSKCSPWDDIYSEMIESLPDIVAGVHPPSENKK
jgi:uncharacterized protein YjbI with pentapeptide repeats